MSMGGIIARELACGTKATPQGKARIQTETTMDGSFVFPTLKCAQMVDGKKALPSGCSTEPSLVGMAGASDTAPLFLHSAFQKTCRRLRAMDMEHGLASINA